jgi:hypothetical protein
MSLYLVRWLLRRRLQHLERQMGAWIPDRDREADALVLALAVLGCARRA